MKLHVLLTSLAIIFLAAFGASSVSATRANVSAPHKPQTTNALLDAGHEHTCVITISGGVQCWGRNLDGQLGDGTTTDRPARVKVAGLSTGATAVAAGNFHTCALVNGGVKCWGSNTNGQLGDGTTTPRLTPVDVSGLTSGVSAIAAGSVHTCAVLTDGGVKCWGGNVDGQLGDGTKTQRLTPTAVTGLASPVTAVSAGNSHTCAITLSGSAHCWGTNANGQLGNGTTTPSTTPVDVSGLTSNVTALAGGNNYTCALVNGGAKCWGSNSYGKLGDGTTTQRTSPVDVSGLASDVVTISAYNVHTCATTTSGGVKCWGFGYHGFLGRGSNSDALTPVNVSGLSSGALSVAVGANYGCALMSDNTAIHCWGENGHGQLGNGELAYRTSPVNVLDGASSATLLDLGNLHACVVINGGVQCWGYNGNGILGDGTGIDRTTPVNVSGLISGVNTIGVGTYHACALMTGGGLKCWGFNTSGQLGDGTTTGRTAPVNVIGLTSGVVAVAGGEGHTCAVVTGGGVKCWGHNTYGQLGDTTTTNRLTAVDVSGLASGVLTLAAGEWHTCALTTGGGVKCWGRNNEGQLGDGTTTQRVTPTDVNGLTSGVTAIAAGAYHTCAVLNTGGAKCWGAGGSGQIGNGTNSSAITSPVSVTGLTSGVTMIAAGSSHTCAVLTGGGAKCWGYNFYGQLGNGTLSERNTPGDVSGLSSGVTALAGGRESTCALLSNGGVKCWGSTLYGQLGIGLIGYYLTPVDTITLISNLYLPGIFK